MNRNLSNRIKLYTLSFLLSSYSFLFINAFTFTTESPIGIIKTYESHVSSYPSRISSSYYHSQRHHHPRKQIHSTSYYHHQRIDSFYAYRQRKNRNIYDHNNHHTYSSWDTSIQGINGNTKGLYEITVFDEGFIDDDELLDELEEEDLKHFNDTFLDKSWRKNKLWDSLISQELRFVLFIFKKKKNIMAGGIFYFSHIYFFLLLYFY